jgi:hypothetical protein
MPPNARFHRDQHIHRMKRDRRDGSRISHLGNQTFRDKYKESKVSKSGCDQENMESIVSAQKTVTQLHSSLHSSDVIQYINSSSALSIHPSISEDKNGT